MEEGARLEALVRGVYEGRGEAEEVAESLGVGLVELGRLVNGEAAREALAGLRRLADARAQMVLSRYRLNAAAKLVELAHGGENTEVARKACVDLLKLEVSGAAGGGTGGEVEGSRAARCEPGDGASGPLDEGRLLAALEAIAAESETLDGGGSARAE